MGRPRKVFEQTEAKVEEQDVPQGVIVEQEETKDEVVKEVYSKDINKQDLELEALRKEVEALRIVAKSKGNATLEEMMKDPLFGTTSYLIFHKNIVPDPRNPSQNIYTTCSLSAFPDAINKNTGEPLAPDEGFDSRKEADSWRENDTHLVQHEGEMMSVKQAIQSLRQKYYDKRKKADIEFLNQQKEV